MQIDAEHEDNPMLGQMMDTSRPNDCWSVETISLYYVLRIVHALTDFNCENVFMFFYEVSNNTMSRSQLIFRWGYGTKLASY